MTAASAIFVLGIIGLMIVYPIFRWIVIGGVTALAIAFFILHETSMQRIQRDVQQQLVSDCNDPFAHLDVAAGVKCPRGTKGNPR